MKGWTEPTLNAVDERRRNGWYRSPATDNLRPRRRVRGDMAYPYRPDYHLCPGHEDDSRRLGIAVAGGILVGGFLGLLLALAGPVVIGGPGL